MLSQYIWQFWTPSKDIKHSINAGPIIQSVFWDMLRSTININRNILCRNTRNILINYYVYVVGVCEIKWIKSLYKIPIWTPLEDITNVMNADSVSNSFFIGFEICMLYVYMKFTKPTYRFQYCTYIIEYIWLTHEKYTNCINIFLCA